MFPLKAGTNHKQRYNAGTKGRANGAGGNLSQSLASHRAGEEKWGRDKAQWLSLVCFHAHQSLPGRFSDTADVWMKRVGTIWAGPSSAGSLNGAFENTTEPHGAPDLSHKSISTMSILLT